MILRLVWSELRHRPGRALFLLGGYALGVAVMVVLLAVGEAMLEQARDRALVGGGEMVLVPAGISTEMLRSGGVEGLFLGIDQARFVQREVLEGPRGREERGIRGASPLLDGKRLEVVAGGRSWRAVATGEIPSRAAAAAALPELLAGRWEDSEADRRWASPTPEELYREIDRFHLPTGEAARDSTWAEWHYFNVMLAEDRWIYLTFMVGGRMAEPGGWGGRILLTIREADGTHRAVTRDFPGEQVRFDTLSPDLRFGEDSYVRLEGGSYRVVARLPGTSIDMRLDPAARRYFPPADLGGTGLLSGYVVPALYAEADGAICLPGSSPPLRSAANPAGCDRVRRVQAYHDHNWGVWRDVSWEWGAASNERLSLLYGVVRGEETPDQGLFVYLVDGQGPVGIYRPGAIRFPELQTVRVNGSAVQVPRQIAFEDARRGLRVTIEVEAVHLTDMERPARRYFVQMRGRARVAVGSREEVLPGFFETYVDP
ncbi:MAG: hypothetical protein ACR2H9_04080 [Longimicrobiaceae bacterium]